MKRFNKIAFLSIILFAFASTFFTACEENLFGGGDSDLPEDVLAINKWVNDIMRGAYLWEREIPSGLNYKKEEDTKAFFDKMIYKKEDDWSWITDDWSAYKDQLSGVYQSMGYSPAFGKFSDSEDVFIIVEYVFGNSPAEKAGIKRGDIILTIDGIQLNTDNYYDLYSGNSYEVGFAVYSSEEGTISLNGKTANLEAGEVTANPVLHYELINLEGYNIGYLVYTDFTSGSNNEFHKSIDDAFNHFKEKGIDNLIVDLRYNPGGEVKAAKYLASSIVPEVNVLDEKVLIKMVYNSSLQDFYENGKKDENLTHRFVKTNVNLNLSTVHFLTTKGTASASELVISGLDPYMDVVMVGDTTHGKYTGSWIWADKNEQHNWAVAPIVFKYSNVRGFTNFKEGIAPDVYVKDQLLDAKPFGDLSDPVLATALQHITGIAPASTLKSATIPKYKQMFPKEMELKRTLRVPAPNDF